MKLVLPHVARPAWLAAFGATMGLLAAVVIFVVAPLTAAPRLALALLIGVAIAIAFRLQRPEAEAAYRLWVRASRLYARVARRALLLLAYAVISAAGAAGNSLALDRPERRRSLWHPRPTLPTTAYSSQFDGRGSSWTGRPWSALVDCGVRSGNLWLAFLVPFLALVSTLDTDDRDRYPTGIYTLF